MADNTAGVVGLEIDLTTKLDQKVKEASDQISDGLSKNIKDNIKGQKGFFGNMMQKVFQFPKRAFDNQIKGAQKMMQDSLKMPEKSFDMPKRTFDMSPMGGSDRLAQTLNNVNQQIEIQQQKLAELKKEYASGLSEKTQHQIEQQNQIMHASEMRIEALRIKLKDLQHSYEVAVSPERKNKLIEEISKTEAQMISLMARSDNALHKITQLEDGMAGEKKNALRERIVKTESSLLNLGKRAEKIRRQMDGAGKSFLRLGRNANKTEKPVRRLNLAFFSAGRRANEMANSFVTGFKRIAKQALVFTVMYQAIRGFQRYMGSLLKTNDEFMHSLNQVRTNLQVAFMPIYEAILPALNALMSALATVTAYIASFVSAIFGKTYKQSFQTAKGLNAARDAMTGYGKASKKAAKDSQKANLQLAGFDELNTLSKQQDSGDQGGADGGAGAGGIAPLITPDIDTSIIDSKMSGLVDKVKDYLKPTTDAFKRLWKAMDPFKDFIAKGVKDFYHDFLRPVSDWTFNEAIPRMADALAKGFQAVNWETINNGLQGLWNALTPFAINVGEGLLWFWESVLVPFGTWTMNEVVPVFLDILSGAIDVLNNTIDAMKPAFQWFWDNLLEPIAEWTGGVINSVLETLSDLLDSIGDWIKEHQSWIEDITVVLLSFATAWGAVNLAIGLWNAVAAIATGTTTILAGAIAFLTSPITITIGVIGALIATGVLLYKNWDVVSDRAKKIWGGIKDLFSRFIGWVKGVFQKDWTKSFGAFGEILNSFSTNAKNIFNGVKKIFNGIIQFVKGAFTGNWRSAWNGVKNVFKGIVDTFGAVMKAPLNNIIGLINSAIGGFNKIKIPNWVPGLGGRGINIPRIPMLAKGGIIDQPTLAMVGEGADHEAVLPLNSSVMGQLGSMIAQNMGGSSQSGQSDETLKKIAEILTMIYQDMQRGQEGDIVMKVDKSELGRVSAKAINALSKQLGRSVIIV